MSPNAHTPPHPAGIWMLCQDSPDFQSVENAQKNMFAPEDPLLDHPFANGDNVASVQPFLLNSLRGLGLPHDFDLQSGSPTDIATACNCLYELIRQRNADRSSIEILEGQACKLRSNASTADRERARALDSLELNKKELGSLEIKVRNMERAQRGELAQVQRDKEASERKLRSAEARHSHLQREIRRKEQDVAELTRKLKASMSSSRSSGGVEQGPSSVYVGGGGGVAALGGEAVKRVSRVAHAQAGRGRSSSGREEAAEADSQLQEMLEISEVQSAALMAENGSLRRSLESARQEAARMIERAEALGFGPALAADSWLGGQDVSHDSLASHEGGGNNAEYLTSTLQVVQDRCRRLLSAPPPRELAKGCGPSCQSNTLAMQLDHARSLMKDQDEAISRAVGALRQAQLAQAQGQRANSNQMAKVLGLERKVSELTTAASEQAELVTQLRVKLQRQAVQAAADSAHRDQDTESCMRTPGSAQSLGLLESRVPELEEEVKVVRKQLDLMRQAVVVTAGKESAEKLSHLVNSASDDAYGQLAEVRKELAMAHHQLERLQSSCEKPQLPPRPQQPSSIFRSPADGDHRPGGQSVAAAPLPSTDSVLQSYARVPICVVRASPAKGDNGANVRLNPFFDMDVSPKEADHQRQWQQQWQQQQAEQQQQQAEQRPQQQQAEQQQQQQGQQNRKKWSLNPLVVPEVSPLELLRNLPVSPGFSISSSGAPSPMP